MWSPDHRCTDSSSLRFFVWWTALTVIGTWLSQYVAWFNAQPDGTRTLILTAMTLAVGGGSTLLWAALRWLGTAQARMAARRAIWTSAAETFDAIASHERFPIWADFDVQHWVLSSETSYLERRREVEIACRAAGNLLRRRWQDRWRHIDPVTRWLQHVADQGEVTDGFTVESMGEATQGSATTFHQIERVTASSARVCRLAAADARPHR